MKIGIKKTVYTCALFSVGLFILNFYVSLYMYMEEAAYKIEVNKVVQLHYLAMIICFIFGILIESNRIIAFLQKKIQFKLTAVFIIGLIMFSIGLISATTYISWFGLEFWQPFPRGRIGINMFVGILTKTISIQSILSVVGGTLVVKGLFPDNY